MKNIIFIGTNYFAASVLKKLLKKKINITNVITKNNKKIGRGQIIKPHPVSIAAKQNKIKVNTTENINSIEIKNIIKNINPNIIIMIEYGEKIDNKTINIPTHGIINLHPSILPQFRGPAPIQHTIINGNKETGVSIISINENIDLGDILNIVKCKIKHTDTYISLSKKLINIGTECLITTLNEIENKTIKKYKQDKHQSSYAPKFNNNYYKINWYDSALNINRKIRAFFNIKKFTTNIDENEIKIIETIIIKRKKQTIPGTIIKINTYGIDVMTNENAIRIKKIQFPGKKINIIKNILNSKKDLFKIGNKFE